MTSQSCHWAQRGPEKVHMHPKGPCCKAHCFSCSLGSSLPGSSLGPPKKCGGLIKPVQSSTVGSWVAEWQAGLLSLLLLLLWCMPKAGGLEVEMAGTTQMAFLNDDVTIPCYIPGSPHLDVNILGIIWSFKDEKDKSEVPVFEFHGDHLKAIRPGARVSLLGLEWGNASLYLPRIQLREAGEYQCKFVVTPEQAEGTTRLDVVAYPVTSLFVKPATVRNGEEKHIICKLDGFHPETIDIKWEKYTLRDFQFPEITEDIVTGPTVKNDDGTFSVTSSMTVKPALEGHVYQCVVSHRSLIVPQKLNIRLPEEEPGSVEIYVTIVGPCVLLASVIIYTIWTCL